jgi:hypothetical protein
MNSKMQLQKYMNNKWQLQCTQYIDRIMQLQIYMNSKMQLQKYMNNKMHLQCTQKYTVTKAKRDAGPKHVLYVMENSVFYIDPSENP